MKKKKNRFRKSYCNVYYLFCFHFLTLLPNYLRTTRLLLMWLTKNTLAHWKFTFVPKRLELQRLQIVMGSGNQNLNQEIFWMQDYSLFSLNFWPFFIVLACFTLSNLQKCGQELEKMKKNLFNQLLNGSFQNRKTKIQF